MRKKILYFSICVVLIIFPTACKHYSSNNNNNISDTLLTKTISFPNCLLKLNDTKFSKIDSFINTIKGKAKIVSIVDGNCMKCIINQLNYIDSLFNNILNDSDNLLIFVLNVSSSDSAYFMRNLEPAIKVKGTILWDNNYNFEKENKLFSPDENLRTFMVNKENKIVMYGNPVFNPDIIYEYKKYLDGR